MYDDGTMTTSEVAALVRVTYRQLDYWVRAGYLPIDAVRPGSGAQRHWSPPEVARARAFGALLHAGVTPVAIAEAMPSLIVGDELFAVRIGVLTVAGPLP